MAVLMGNVKHSKFAYRVKICHNNCKQMYTCYLFSHLCDCTLLLKNIVHVLLNDVEICPLKKNLQSYVFLSCLIVSTNIEKYRDPFCYFVTIGFDLFYLNNALL